VNIGPIVTNRVFIGVLGLNCLVLYAWFVIYERRLTYPKPFFLKDTAHGRLRDFLWAMHIYLLLFSLLVAFISWCVTLIMSSDADIPLGFIVILTIFGVWAALIGTVGSILLYKRAQAKTANVPATPAFASSPPVTASRQRRVIRAMVKALFVAIASAIGAKLGGWIGGVIVFVVSAG
jgi:hypothetical protein